MAEDETHIYLTRSGRKAKQKYISYTFSGKNKQTYKMPIIPEDRPINTNKSNENDAREQDREGLNRLREESERTR